MLRWNEVDDQEIFGMTVKMYRDPYEVLKKSAAPIPNLELDHYAYKYLQTELFMYKVLDTNFINYIEERGDMHRVSKIYIPVQQDSTRTTY